MKENDSTKDSPNENKAVEYVVWVDDNYHFMDEDERYCAGKFSTFEAALEKATSIVEESLKHCWEPGMTTGELEGRYKMFGDDPWVMPIPEGIERFSAWGYAAREVNRIVKEESEASAAK